MTLQVHRKSKNTLANKGFACCRCQCLAACSSLSTTMVCCTRCTSWVIRCELCTACCTLSRPPSYCVASLHEVVAIPHQYVAVCSCVLALPQSMTQQIIGQPASVAKLLKGNVLLELRQRYWCRCMLLKGSPSLICRQHQRKQLGCLRCLHLTA